MPWLHQNLFRSTSLRRDLCNAKGMSNSHTIQVVMSSLGAVPHSTASGTGRPAGRAAHREESRVLTEQIAAAPGAEKAPDYELRGARLLADATRPQVVSTRIVPVRRRQSWAHAGNPAYRGGVL